LRTEGRYNDVGVDDDLVQEITSRRRADAPRGQTVGRDDSRDNARTVICSNTITMPPANLDYTVNNHHPALVECKRRGWRKIRSRFGDTYAI